MTPHPSNGHEDNLIEAATALTKGDIIPSRPLRVRLGKRLLELEDQCSTLQREKERLQFKLDSLLPPPKFRKEPSTPSNPIV